MACTVNLVPEAAQHLMRRAQRLKRWAGVLVCAALLTGLLGVFYASAMREQKLAADALVNVRAREAGVARDQTLLDQARRALLERSELLRQVTPRNPWAERLTRIARDLPEAVVLTSLRGSTSTGPAPAASANSAGAAPPRGRATKPPSSAPAAAFELDVQGLALRQGNVTQLIECIQRMPGFGRVDLLRAVHEPRTGGELVRFQIDCHGKETAP